MDSYTSSAHLVRARRASDRAVGDCDRQFRLEHVGFGAQTTAPNQMMLGTATNIYALPGAPSAASRAAQKGAVLMLTIDAAGNVATAPIPGCRCPPPPIKPKSRRS
jgi:hypothetical protein